MVIDHTNIAGGTSVYEVVYQIQLGRRQEMDNDRRGDVTLLINGLPVIHIELKTPKRSYLQAFNQIQKYITEQKFNGILSNIQMFVVTNGTDTKYVAADQHLRENSLVVGSIRTIIQCVITWTSLKTCYQFQQHTTWLLTTQSWTVSRGT